MLRTVWIFDFFSLVNCEGWEWEEIIICLSRDIAMKNWERPVRLEDGRHLTMIALLGMNEWIDGMLNLVCTYMHI